MAMKKVLVVDDSPEVAEALSRTLRLSGYDVDTYIDSEKALKGLLAKDYDCVVSDGEMPVLSGPALMQAAIKAKPKMAKRFVFNTGSPIAVMSALQDIGEAKVLFKPAHKSDLLDAVERAIKS